MNTSRFIVYLSVFLLISPHTYSILPTNGIGSKATALGQTSVCQNDFWSQFNNQAGIAHNDNFMLGSFYENRFLLKSLSTKAVGFLIPLNHSSLGANIIHYGDALYSEMNIGIAYGRKLSKNLSAGIQIDYFTIRQANGYGNKNNITFEVGFIYQVDDKMKIGGHFYNPFSISNKTEEIILPEIYRLGLEYLIDNNLFAYVEFQNNNQLGSSCHFGLEYLWNSIAIRTGYATNPDQLSFGIGFKLKKLQLDISSSLHQFLGVTPQFSFSYQF